jgi:hypothetical protein
VVVAVVAGGVVAAVVAVDAAGVELPQPANPTVTAPANNNFAALERGASGRCPDL